jgi:hypothetical protein
VEEVDLHPEQDKVKNRNISRKKTEDLVKDKFKKGSDGIQGQPVSGGSAGVDEELQTSPSTEDPVYERPERTTGQYSKRPAQRPSADPSGPGSLNNVKLENVNFVQPEGTAAPPELETADPQSYDPFLEYLDAYPDLTQINSGSGQNGFKLGGSSGSKSYPTTVVPIPLNENGYLKGQSGIAVTSSGYSGFQGVELDINGQLGNPTTGYPEISTIRTNSDGYSGFIDRFTTISPIADSGRPFPSSGSPPNQLENSLQAYPLTSQQKQTFPEQELPYKSNQGQGYYPESSQGQAYPIINLGPPKTSQGSENLFPINEGLAPESTADQNGFDSPDIASWGQVLPIIGDNDHLDNIKNLPDQNGLLFQKGVVEDISSGGLDSNGFLPTQRNPGRLRLPTRPASIGSNAVKVENGSVNRPSVEEVSQESAAALAAFGQIPVVKLSGKQPAGGDVVGLEGFLDSSLPDESGGGERSKPKRKYETVSRGGQGTATKGEPTFINIDTTAIPTTDPPASR